MTFCHASSVRSTILWKWMIPALFTRMSMRLYLSRTSSTIVFTATLSVTSAGAGKASPPCSRMESTATATVSSRRSLIATFAPSAAKARAIARPIPLAAPVTRATLFSRRMFQVLLVKNRDLGPAVTA